MKGTASLFVKESVLTKLIPVARKAYKSEIENKPDQLYFSQEHETKIEIHELSNETFGFSMETPFGEVNVYLAVDRQFLADVADIAIERTRKAIKILNNEG